MAPTGSSTLIRSKKSTESTTNTPATMPIISELGTLTNAQGAVKDHREIRLAQKFPGHNGCGHCPTRGSGICRHGNPADCIPVRSHGATRIKPEPAEPKDKGTDSSCRNVMSGDRNDLSIFAVLADARTEHRCPNQRGPTADGMDLRGAGKVEQPKLREPATAPDPVTNYRIDNPYH